MKFRNFQHSQGKNKEIFTSDAERQTMNVRTAICTANNRNKNIYTIGIEIILQGKL